MEALRIYGNQFGGFICWQCKRQFTSEKAHLAHLREHDELRELEELERTRRKKEEEAERKRREHAERKERRRKVFIYDEDISQRIGEVFVSGLTTIGQLKHICGIDRIRILAFQGRALDDEEIVHDAGLRDNNEIHILISDEERKRRDLEEHEAMRRAQADVCRLETEQGMRSKFMSDPKRRERLLRQRAKNLRLAYGEGHRAADQALVGQELRQQDRIFTTRRLRRSSIRHAKKRLNERVKQGDLLHKRVWG